MSIVEGLVDFVIPEAGKPCHTWYIVYGDLKSSQHRPLVILAGGPGMPHNYLKPYGRWLASKALIPVVLYDTIGCGNSTLLPEKFGDGSFFNVDLHMRELDNLLKKLGIQENYALLGHSYGASLASLYAATKQPEGLRLLILQSGPASMDLWDEAQMDLRHQLPQELQSILSEHEANKTTSSEQYQDVIKKFWLRHLCRIDPTPEDLADTLNAAETDSTVVLTMYGDVNDKFHTRGTLAGWSAIDELHKIKVPTLLMNGRYDTGQDKVMTPFFNFIPKVRWVQFPASSHTAHLESEQDRVFETVLDFLTEK